MLPPDRPKQPWDDELVASLEKLRSETIDKIISEMADAPPPEDKVRRGVGTILTELLPRIDELLAQQHNFREYVRISPPESKERAERLGKRSLASQQGSINELLENRREALKDELRTTYRSAGRSAHRYTARHEAPTPLPQSVAKAPEELVRPPGAAPAPEGPTRPRRSDAERRAKSAQNDADYRRAFHVDQGDSALREGIEYGLPGEHTKRAKEWYGIDPTKEHDGGAFLREMERLSDKDHASQNTSPAGDFFSVFMGWFCGKPCCITAFIAAVVLLGMTQPLFN